MPPEFPYKVGDRVLQYPFGEPAAARWVLVTGKSNDIKNGRRGFDGVLGSGMTVWGYDKDIRQVIPAERSEA